MTQAQAGLYDSCLAAARQRLEAAGRGDLGDLGGAALVKRLGVKHLKNVFTELRKIAQHPILVQSGYSKSDLDRLAPLLRASGVFGDKCTVERVR